MKNFYVFEGTDGSGKTTLSREITNIINMFEDNKVIYTREPGGSNVKASEEIRSLILKDSMGTIESETEYLLYLSSRKEHIEKFIKPNSIKNKIVLCDRFNDSSLAYQGYAKGGDVTKLENISKLVIGDSYPDYTFFIDINPELGIQRIMSNRKNEVNRLDRMSNDFYYKVYNAYKSIIKKNPKKYFIIDGTLEIKINATIISYLLLNDYLVNFNYSKIKKTIDKIYKVIIDKNLFLCSKQSLQENKKIFNLILKEAL